MIRLPGAKLISAVPGYSVFLLSDFLIYYCVTPHAGRLTAFFESPADGAAYPGLQRHCLPVFDRAGGSAAAAYDGRG